MWMDTAHAVGPDVVTRRGRTINREEAITMGEFGTMDEFGLAEFSARIDRAVAAAAGAGFDGLLVTPGPDLVYLCGYAPDVTERLTMLAMTTGGAPTLVVPRLERPDAEKAPGVPALTLRDWLDGDDPYAAVAPLLAAGGRYAISDSAWAMHLLGLQRAVSGSRYVSFTEGLPMLRAVKDAHEIDCLAAAGAAADAAFVDLLGVRFSGRRESDVAADLADLMHAHGHSQVDFTVVGSGPHGADPHHAISDRVITPGDAVVLDFGGLVRGYSSDITRTVSVGEPSDELRTVYEIVRTAQQAGFEAVAAGVACQEIDRVSRRVITEAGYGEYFIHRVGHGIGLATHEPPYLVEGETQELVRGMCFSIEPGIYLPGRLGVRIEDIVTVTDDGGRRLNDVTRDLQVVA